jgi:hypothetical protein
MPETVHSVRDGQKFAGDADLTVVTCATCHITYAIPTTLDDAAQRWRGDRTDGRGWKLCCPMGHNWWYVGESEHDRLKRIATEARQRAAAERDLREHTEHQLRGQKAATTRARNQRDRDRRRVAAGVCPCCNRTFQNLARHMAGQHPDYGPSGHDDE